MHTILWKPRGPFHFYDVPLESNGTQDIQKPFLSFHEAPSEFNKIVVRRTQAFDKERQEEKKKERERQRNLRVFSVNSVHGLLKIDCSCF